MSRTAETCGRAESLLVIPTVCWLAAGLRAACSTEHVAAPPAGSVTACTESDKRRAARGWIAHYPDGTRNRMRRGDGRSNAFDQVAGVMHCGRSFLGLLTTVLTR